MKKSFLYLTIISFTLIFVLGVYVGVYKIFPYEILDSSRDVFFGQRTIENNQFINQANVNSLIKIDSKSDIDQKRNFLTDHFSGTLEVFRV